MAVGVPRVCWVVLLRFSSTDQALGFDLLHRHFYEGYNRILFRALELERREFDSPPYAASLADGSAATEMEPEPEPQLSVTFESPIALPPLPPLSPSQTRSPARRGPEARPQPVRRNTTQGILDHGRSNESVPENHG